MADAFLQIENLKTHFPVEHGIIVRRHLGTVKAVDGVSFSLTSGEILGLVGESGCGKSTLGRTILQLIPPTEGAVILAGKNLARLKRDGTARGARRLPDDFPGPVRLAQSAHDRVRCLAEAHPSASENPGG